MLTISFGTRTDSTTDPLVEQALTLAMEFMDLTGTHSDAFALYCLYLPSFQGHGQMLLISLSSFSGSRLVCAREGASCMMTLLKCTVR
jgi:hypothetical protein